MNPAAKLPPCDQLDLVHVFADGEMPAPEAARFRAHLAGCTHCQAELEDVLQLTNLASLLERRSASGELAAEPAAKAASRRVLPHWMRREGRGRALRAGVGLLAAAAAVAVVVRLAPRGESQMDDWETRSLEVRLSYPAAAGYKPYDVPRGGNASASGVSLEKLARLEKKGDAHGVGVGLLLRGEVAQAEKALSQAPDSPRLRSDRAAVLIARVSVSRDAQPQPGAGEPLADALSLLAQALEQDPRLPQARWNQGLALRELGLQLSAAEAFADVAAQGEPGWAEEARARAASLRADYDARTQAWRDDRDLGLAALGGGPLPEEALRRHPGLMRLWLYDAVRVAPDDARLQQLLPAARVLDTISGGDALARLVQRSLGRPHQKRAALAARYLQLARRQLDAAAKQQLEQDVLASELTDLAVGVLGWTDHLFEHVEVVQRLARETQDPWFQAMAAHAAGKRAFARHEFLEAQELLGQAFEACRTAHVEYRCAAMASDLIDAWLELDRPAEAWRVANTALRVARAGGEWLLEGSVVSQAAQLARRQRWFPLSRAFLQEALLRRPGDCGLQRYVHQASTSLALWEFKFAEARKELSLVPDCAGEAPTSIDLEMSRSELIRLDPRPGDLGLLRQRLGALRAAGKLSAGEAALADHVEGRAVIESDRAAGQELQRAAIAAAAAAPGDENARKARGYAFGSLVLDAAKAGDWGSALALLAEEEGAPAPERCALGVAIDVERRAAVARGAKGELVGDFAADVRGPIADPASLVSKPMLEALRACPEVSVFARPPLHGRAGLLPRDFAWSYRVGRPHAAAGPAQTRELVVTDVQAPPSLGLPHLADWSTPSRPGAARVELRGADATPARVLAEVAQAGVVEIHAHGLVDLAASDASMLVLAPGADGVSTLTAREVRRARLGGAPLVLLAACSAAGAGTGLDAPWSLPVAFLDAGARAVVASTAEIPDAQARGFFEGIKARVAAGATPAAAARDERAACRTRGGDCAWADRVLVFD